jgi:hypothetical protein
MTNEVFQLLMVTQGKNTAIPAINTLTPASQAPIVNLIDGRSYIVTAASGSSFQLEDPATLAVETISAGGGSASSTFSIDGLRLTSQGSGAQELLFPITPGSGSQQLVGIGANIPFAASTGDGTISASATGGGGGAISVSTADSHVNYAPTVTTEIGSNASLTSGSNITVTTHGYVRGSTISSNGGGGLIAVTTAAAKTAISFTNNVKAASGATLTALGTHGPGHVTVAANSDLTPTVIASTGSGGLFAGSDSGGAASADYTTQTTINGGITAAGAATVNARTSIDNGLVQTSNDIGGLGTITSSDAELDIGQATGTDLVDIQGAGTINANTISVNGVVDNLQATVKSNQSTVALGAGSNASSTIKVSGEAQVRLASGSYLTGNVSVGITAGYGNVNLESDSHASCGCLGGSTNADATINDNSDAHIAGVAGSTIKTASLTVSANQVVTNFHDDASTDGGFLDFGNGGQNHPTTNLFREIYWQSTVIILPSPNPVLTIDASGKVVADVNVSAYDCATGGCAASKS